MNTSNCFYSGPNCDLPLSPEHGAQILCMDVRGDLIVTGSADHGLRCYSASSGKQLKELFAKNYGHTEWVTCCAILPDMRVISGGMDSNICIWESKGVKCSFICEHTGSISKIITDEDGVFLSSSYDSSIRIYNVNSGGQALGLLKGVHKGPITEFAWNGSLCVSGGRDGTVALWDINSETCLLKQTLHKGIVGNIKLHSDEGENNLILTTASDGILNAIDMRTNQKIFSKQIHAGAINYLACTQSNIIITGSADKTIKLFDMTNNFNEMASVKATDAIFCGDIKDSFLAVGCGDGNLLGYNLDTMECLFGYGCEKEGGIKCVKILPEKKKIVTAGDSGQGLMLVF